MASSGSAAHFYSYGMERVWQSDFTKASAVHKCKFLDFFDLCVRKVDFLHQFTVVTGMRSQHLEARVSSSVPIPVELTHPCDSPGIHSSWQLLLMSSLLQDKSG